MLSRITIRNIRFFLHYPGIVLLLCFLTISWHHARLSAPEPTLMLLDRHGRFLGHASENKARGYGYWQLEDIPERVAEATIAIEDRRFQYHPGVDPLAVIRALWQNLSSGHRVSGASTLAMQVARMQRPGDRTYLKKALEAATAVFLTIRYGRREILRHYLRIVPYGNNIYGIGCAAAYYLDKPVEDLSWAEIALLCAIPQAPGRMNPFSAIGRTAGIKRGQRILDALFQKQVMTAGELELARLQLLRICFPERRRRPESALHGILRMEKELTRNPSWKSVSKRPRIFTTIDLDLQKQVHSMANRYLADWRKSGADNIAVMILLRKTREVLVYMGSCDYFDPSGGAVDYNRLKRSPGSALKPFLYALALDRGHITPATILDDLPQNSHGFVNADRQFLGPLLPRQALANSRNVPAVDLLKIIGIDETYLLFRNLGLHDNRRPAIYYGLTMAVGGMPVTLEQLVRAYGAIADDGLLADLKWYRGENRNRNRRILSDDAARQIALFLSDPMARLPVFQRMGPTEYPFPVAVKTGTSQGFRNAWAVAWSTDYIAGVWTGRLDNGAMDEMSGSRGPARLIRDILLHLHRRQSTGMHDLSFPHPEDHVPVTICTRSGKVDLGNCPQTFQEWLAPDQKIEYDDMHLKVSVDKRNGLLAAPWTEEKWVEQPVFIKLPARYIDWASNQHLSLPPSRYSLIDMPENTTPPSMSGADRWINAEKNQIVHLMIDSPQNGLKIISRPDIPSNMNSLSLKVTVDPMVEQILWYVDNEPYMLTGPPFTVRWQLKPGTHCFHAGIPFRDERSESVTVMVE